MRSELFGAFLYIFLGYRKQDYMQQNYTQKNLVSRGKIQRLSEFSAISFLHVVLLPGSDLSNKKTNNFLIFSWFGPQMAMRIKFAAQIMKQI